MKITFNIRYKTQWGESLYIVGNIPIGKINNPLHPQPLELEGYDLWCLTIDTDPDQLPDVLTYEYIVIGNHSKRKEFGEPRSLRISKYHSSLLLIDKWRDIPKHKHLYSSAFTKGIFARVNPSKGKQSRYPQELTLRINAPQIPPEYTLAVAGNIPSLGKWNENKMVCLDDSEFPMWQTTIAIGEEKQLSFKFAIYDKTLKKVVKWENTNNREIELTDCGQTILSDMNFLYYDLSWKGAGVALPIFAMRSLNSFGIGEFPDLKLLADWAKKTGQRVIQTLPINDTTMLYNWQDSYPYKAISTYALHPIYLSIHALKPLKDAAIQSSFESKGRALNQLAEIDYDQVISTKWEYFKLHYQCYGKKILSSPDYLNFYKKNQEWLPNYALFCYLRDRFHSAVPATWPEPYNLYSEKLVEEICQPQFEHYDQVAIHLYLQYLLDQQLSDATKYSKSLGVILKGDIPIGISRDSVEAWIEPELFNLNAQAGAPPDDFSVLGQNWGFPTYNWEAMEQNNYKWWTKRFQKMADYFDAYRIDHILGFFRIWEIPMHSVHGLAGYFSPALPFSTNEIYQYGFPFDPQFHTAPYIREYFLGELFGEYTQEVIDNYLDPISWGCYKLKERVNTQRKCKTLLDADDVKTTQIREGLYRLADEILFINDPHKPGHYHPRISAQHTKAYEALDEHAKQQFNALYNDFYFRRHNYFWKEIAMKKLPALIHSTPMLVCGEDLGMIPQSVPETMRELQILSLEIQRMPKDNSVEFGYTRANPYLSISTTSTHDMDTVRGWWEEDRSRSQRYYNQVLMHDGEAPYFCEPWLSKEILYKHLQCPSILTILPLQDWMSIDGHIRRNNPEQERINIPSNPNHYWRFRLHITLEELLEADKFNQEVKDIIGYSGRL